MEGGWGQQGYDQWGNPLPPGGFGGGMPPMQGGWEQQQGGWEQQGPPLLGGFGGPHHHGHHQGGGGWNEQQQGGWNQPSWNQPQQPPQNQWGQQPGWNEPQHNQWGQPPQQPLGGGFGGFEDQSMLTDWFEQRDIQPVMQVKQRDGVGGGDDNDLFGNWLQDQMRRQQYELVGPNVDIGSLINQQVVFLEPSPVQQKIEQLKREGRIFDDTVFPPNQKSLTGEWGTVSEWRNISWKRMSQIINNPRIFDDKVEPEDIKQGYLGDCYFLAALAALAEKPQRIFNLFLTQQRNQQEYYACKILYKGKWKTIDLDDYIPVMDGKPAFSKASGPETWVILLEKAWSKLYSSYKRIEAGYPEEGLHDLTGAHIQAYRTKAADFDKEEVWRYLLVAEDRDYSMIASSQPGSDTNTSKSGIVQGHAYTLLGAYGLNTNSGQVRLVKLRNPWGKSESNSQWNDTDSKWNMVSPQDKQRLGFNPNANDGTFFLLYDQFITEFRMMTCAEVNDNASYVYLTQKSSKQKGNYFKVEILREGEYSFQINQIPERAFEDKLQDQYNFSMATIIIGRLVGPNQVQWLEGSQSAFRTLFKKHKLPPGQYIVFGKIFFNDKWEKDYELTLAIYGDYACRINLPQQYETQGFKEKLYAGKAMQSSPKQARPGVFYNQEILKEGYVYAAVINQSQMPVTFNLSVQQNSNPKFQLKKPFKGQRQISQQVPPGGYVVVLGRAENMKDYTTSGIGTISIN